MADQPDLSSLRIDRTPPSRRGGSTVLTATVVFVMVVVHVRM